MKKINSKKTIKFVAQTATIVAVTVGILTLANKVGMPKDKAVQIAYRIGVSIVLLEGWNISSYGAGKLVDSIFEDDLSKS